MGFEGYFRRIYPQKKWEKRIPIDKKLNFRNMTATSNGWGLKQSITILRILIGWHFLYEGIVKVYNPDWTSFGYLASAQGPLKPVFQAMTSEGVLPWVDTLNWVALVFVGVTLILGIHRGELLDRKQEPDRGSCLSRTFLSAYGFPFWAPPFIFKKQTNL